MKAQNTLAAHPMMQYMGYLQRPDGGCKRIRSVPLGSFAAIGDRAETVLFRTRTTVGAPDHRALAMACIDRANEKLGMDKVSRFSVVVAAPGKDGRGGTSIETYAGPGGGTGHALETA